jgi:hypothetical protein
LFVALCLRCCVRAECGYPTFHIAGIPPDDL